MAGKSPKRKVYSQETYFLYTISHRIHGAGIYANIGDILMGHVTTYGIHGSYGYSIIVQCTEPRDWRFPGTRKVLGLSFSIQWWTERFEARAIHIPSHGQLELLRISHGRSLSCHFFLGVLYSHILGNFHIHSPAMT